jgi:predicted Rossmann fold flavoprotein
MNTEIAIIGGGASGLAAGALLSSAGKKSIIIERETRVGKKLLATGNGRCNLGNKNLEMHRYHGNVGLAHKIFADWQGAENFFKDFGLICHADGDLLYPYSNFANSVLDALRFACTGVEFLCDTPCYDIKRVNSGFLINNSIHAEKVIWSCGNSVDSVNSTNVSILGELGHTIKKPFPSLCPIVTAQELTRPLKGLRVRALCKAMVKGEVLKTEEGTVQFKEDSLSGICIMNLSRLVKNHGNKLTISLDIAPEFSLEQLRSIPLTALFHSRIVSALENQPIKTIKDWRFPVTGVYTNAIGGTPVQVVAGGVPGGELNADLSSKACPGLYVVGEAVNVDGDCGGYNLEWAWASANTAAKACI